MIITDLVPNKFHFYLAGMIVSLYHIRRKIIVRNQPFFFHSFAFKIRKVQHSSYVNPVYKARGKTGIVSTQPESLVIAN
jgi:hypothetical protein